jgi:hypothetical protein
MSLNFNVDPYYDDFDPAKNYHRILFKPGYAVQARELTQSQSILQNQISNFADNIFKQNTPITGGQITTNLNCYYVKLQTTFNNVTINPTTFVGKLVQDVTGTVKARIIAAASSSGIAGDSPTIIVTYTSGIQFTDGAVIYDASSLQAISQTITSASTGSSSVASVSQGVFYISSNYTTASGEVITKGTFVQVNPQTVILDKYDSIPNLRVGLNIVESITTYLNDSSLLDPAIGASNYQAPGADRYKIDLVLETRPLLLGNDDSFIELIRVINGEVQTIVNGTVYNVIDDYFAKRDYETNGDYIVNDFRLTPKANTADASNNSYIMSVGKGIAYVHGYRIENQAPIDLTTMRSRTTVAQNNNPSYISYGNYFYVDTVRGANGQFFDTTTYSNVDFHCVTVANVSVATSSSYSSTIVATGYIRGLEFDHSTGTTANSYVYRMYIDGLQANSISANVTAATPNTVTFPSYFSASNTAYPGMTISIYNGTDAGDSRVIVAYNGVSKVATINQNWTTTPDTTSQYTLNFDIKYANTVVFANKSSFPAQIYSTALIDESSKANGVPLGLTTLQNPTYPELIFPVGSPYVANLTNTTYTTQQLWRNVGFTSTGVGSTVSTALQYTGDYSNVIRHIGTGGSTLSSSLVKQNFVIVVTAVGGGCTLNVGEVVPWTTTGRTVVLSSDASTATLQATDVGGTFTATILATVYAVNADNTTHLLRNKTLISGNTTVINSSNTQVATYTYVDNTATTSKGQVYIQNAGIVNPGKSQSLYLSDVKNIVRIIDTGSSSTLPTASMLVSGSSYDITSRFNFDNGQRDGFYDHASITLKPGYPKPSGNMLVVLNYYQHTGGDGYFSVQSYLNEAYQQIPQYTSKAGIVYALRDCLDFRPARLNAQTLFTFRYSNSGDTTKYGVFLPIDMSTFTGYYNYYLGRKDKLVLTKDKSFKVIEGTPSIAPLFPAQPDGSLVIANLSLDPYTGYLPTEAPSGSVSNLSVEKVKHKRYTMEDIAGLEKRINNVEYYASLSQLEQTATSQQISDAYGLNRFKNGIIVDDFSSYATADTLSQDYSATINRRERRMTATQNVKNYPLKASALAYNMGLPSSATSSALGYNISYDGYVNYFTLPYTTANVFSQKLASRTTNVNPFAYVTNEGVLSLSPNMDNWVDTNYSPALLITDPNLQVFQASENISVLSSGDWKTISGTTTSDTTYTIGHGINPSPFGRVGYSTTTSVTTTQQAKTDILGPYDKIGSTYSLNNGYITDISVLPYIRPQQIVVRAGSLLTDSPVTAYFDNASISNYIRKTNIIELSNVTGVFKQDDVLGYYSSGIFTPTARVVGVYNYANTTSTRLYVAADPSSTTYNNSLSLVNGFFNVNGIYQGNTATGTISSTKHYGGRIKNANSTTSIQLSVLASTINNYYTGNTIYICAGTGKNQSATISNYYGANQVAVLSSSITSANGDIYSIGSFSTDETGAFYGIFNLPENTFHTGQRVLRIDNSTGGNQTSATTYAQATYYAEGLQTTQQRIDFGASPAGAKGTFTQTSQQQLTSVSVSLSPWDPVAQGFIVSKKNYPNGIFLNSIKVFFRTKPTTENVPITLSIVGTLNGYPNGDTLDHSVVTLTPDVVNTSETPQYLDGTTSTTFQFSVPVYIQSDVLYAFIVKSDSNQYTLWTAANGDTAVGSSAKNLPTDNTPSIITKIGGAPYVGGLFISQNSQTWTADQNQALMMVADQCLFTTSATPQIPYLIPKLSPQRELIEQSVDYYTNANNVSNTLNSISNSTTYADAFNITTTDFTPTTTQISYNYVATLASGSNAGYKNITPGKYGTATADDIYLDDGNGERVILPYSNNSFILNATLSSTDSYVSPVISDAGLSAYVINWNINNCSLSNSLIQLSSGGTGYSNNANLSVTISAPTGFGGSSATAAANVENGVIKSIYITNGGSGYLTTPTITIADANTTPGTNASANVIGETSQVGGPALTKYVTRPIQLAQGNDSGDLNVYLTAYRPPNTDINVYYKILNRNDTQGLNNSSWQLMTKINNSNTQFSLTRTDTYEYAFAPGTAGVDVGYVNYVSSTTGQTYTTFSQFAIKIVLTTTDNTFVPYVTDMRALALPSNVNTTF